MKKVLAVLLAGTIFFGMTACGGKGGAGGSEGNSPVSQKENLGFEDPGNYTLQAAMETTPSKMSPMSWETATDGEIMDYITSSLFSVDFDKEHLGYGYVPQAYMAKELPKDVTSEFAGKKEYNVPADAKEGYAYKIDLVENAAWDDGTPIKAEDFLYSLKAMLDPKMQNKRADSYYASTLVIAHAEDYVKQGMKTPIGIEKYSQLKGAASFDAFLQEHGSEPAMVDWGNSFGEIYDPQTKAWSKDNLPKGPVAAGLSIAEMKDLFLSKGKEMGVTEDKALEFYRNETLVNYEYPEMDFSKVGIKQDGDYTFTVILDKPLVGFELLLNLGGRMPLVKKDIWEKTLETNAETGAVSSKYGTKLELTPSYGPYKLKTFQDDKLIELVRNDHWYGYHDERFKGQYQTDAIRYTIVKENSTRLQMFLKGQLDAFPLDVNTIEDYRGSKYIHFTPSSYTEELNMNMDLKSLEARQSPGINKTILTIKDFRKALTLSLDRADLAKSTSAASMAGFGLFNSYYVTETEKMGVYRDTEEAKKTLLDVYGVEYGSGKQYATVDEAYAAMTGFNLEMAKKLFDSAYDQAIEKGLMKPTDKVVLTQLGSVDNELTRKRFNYIKEHWIKAVEGTKLEGKLDVEFDATLGEGVYQASQDGKGDLMTAGWAGEVYNPYFLMLSGYLQQNLARGLDTGKKVDIELADGKKTMSMMEWAVALNGGDPKNPYGLGQTSLENRIKILAGLEKALLEEYCCTPLMYGASASLRSQRVEWLTYEYNKILGWGSTVDYRTYNYTDEEWAKYVKEQGGELSYK